jgi:hypothetical protein
MGDAPTFMIKGDAHAFMMIDRMGDALAFMIKGDAPNSAHLLYLNNQRHAIGTCISLLSHAEKIISFLPSTEPVPLLADAGASHFTRYETLI